MARGVCVLESSSYEFCFVIQVKAILVNIFGGIVKCATIANGIIAACKEIQLSIPLVIRLEGEQGYDA